MKSFSSIQDMMAFGNERNSPLEKPMSSPELQMCTPETALRDAGIRKFVNPYKK